MSRPEPEAIDPAAVRELALAVIADDRFPHLASIDGDQPRLRPVSPVRTEAFTAFVANLRDYHKTGEIDINPKVELCYLSKEHNQVRITARAEVVTDRALIEDIFAENNLLRHYLGSPDNPQLIIYRMVPVQVRYMQEWALQYFEVPIEPASSPDIG